MRASSSLVVHIANKLTWSKHTKTVVKRARKHLLHLRRLKKFGMGPKILQLHHREPPEWLHHCLVWQFFGLRPQGITEGDTNSPLHHWGQASCHPGPLYQSLSEEGPQKCQTLATLVIDCSLCYRTARGTGAPSLGPRGF